MDEAMAGSSAAPHRTKRNNNRTNNSNKNQHTIRMRPPSLHWALSQSHGYPRERGDRRIQRSLKRWGRKTHDTNANKKAPRTLRWRASTWREAHLGKARIREGGAQGPPPPLSSRGPEHFHNLHMHPPGFMQLVLRGPQPRYPPAAPSGCYNPLRSALPPRSPGKVLSHATRNAGRYNKPRPHPNKPLSWPN